MENRTEYDYRQQESLTKPSGGFYYQYFVRYQQNHFLTSSSCQKANRCYFKSKRLGMMQKERTEEGEQKVDLSLPSTVVRLSQSNSLGPLSNPSQSVESQRLSFEYGSLPPVGGGSFLMNSFVNEPSVFLMNNPAALMRRQQEEQQLHATRLLLLQQHQDQALQNSIGAVTNNLFAAGLGGPMGGGGGVGGALGGLLSAGLEGSMGGVRGGGFGAGHYFSGNTAASRASLDHFSVMLQQYQSRNQLLQAGYLPQINLNSNMTNTVNTGMSLLQHRQLQEESWNAELKAAAASSSSHRSSSKSVNAQLDANAAYYDASKLPDPEYEEGEDDEDDDDDAKRRPHGASIEPFPSKLYRMIEDAEKDGQDDIVSFFPHGRAFAIHKPRVFISQLMPKFFSTSRMSSFQRQLNLYGFRRITEGRDKAGYFHEYFLKGRKGLCKKIQRKKVPKVASIPVTRGPMTFPGGGGLMHNNMGNQNTLLPLSDAASLYQLQMFAAAAAQSGGYGAPVIGGGLGVGQGHRVGGNFGDIDRFSTMLGNTVGLGGARNASIGLSNNTALLLDQKQLLDQLLLQQQIQLLQQTPNFATPRPRPPPRGDDGEMPPSA